MTRLIGSSHDLNFPQIDIPSDYDFSSEDMARPSSRASAPLSELDESTYDMLSDSMTDDDALTTDSLASDPGSEFGEDDLAQASARQYRRRVAARSQGPRREVTRADRSRRRHRRSQSQRD